MKRLAVAATALLVPLLPTTPAFAADNVICVDPPVGATCNQTVATIGDAITAADANAVGDTILLGTGTFTLTAPSLLDGTTHPVTLKGSGPSTVITMGSGASDTYLLASGATVEDLTVQLNPVTSSNDTGLWLSNGTGRRVTIEGAGTSNANGVHLTGASTLSESSVQMPLGSGSRGVYAEGGTTLLDSTIVADTGFKHSGTGTPDTISRVSVDATYQGISTDSGTVDVDDSVIDLGANNNATGLAVVNTNANTAAKAINANHVTIVGGGVGSKGIYAAATRTDVVQQASATLVNSIVRGPTTDLWVEAGTSVAGTATATITTSYSDWSTTMEGVGENGVAQVVVGAGHLDVDPAFVDATNGDYRLATGSPVIDKGSPATAGPSLDLGRATRVTDGNGDGSVVRDLGAFEHATVPIPPDKIAPDTRFVSKPAKRVTTRRVTFRFAATEAGARFSCKLDGRAWLSCASPRRFKVTVGVHRFRVRAIDTAGNVDATPATYRFRRVG